MLRERYATPRNVLDRRSRRARGRTSASSPAARIVLVGNVPYYITTPILFHALEPPRAERAVYLVQREVAERIVAAPGSKEYGALR